MKLAGAYINDDTYERLVALALSHNRTLAGQCRHLFDRALKGDLQVPDAPRAAGKPTLGAVATAGAAKPALRSVPSAAMKPGLHAVAGIGAEKPTAPVAAKPTLRAVARALEALPLTNATRVAEAPPLAATGMKPPRVAAAALRAGGSRARAVSENVSVAGESVGVAAVVPLAVGISATSGKAPATGRSPRAERCAGEDAGPLCGSMISNHTPTMMKTPTPPHAPHRAGCRPPGAGPAHATRLHDNPSLKSDHAAGRCAR